MQTIALVTSLLVLCGAVFMVFAISLGQQTKGQVPPELQSRWRVLIVLMAFFLGGYLLFAALLLSKLKFPTELVTGPIFLGGACFVYIVINLALDTIGRISGAEKNLRGLNGSLEQRVTERTVELQSSQEFLQTVLDSLNDGVSIIDVCDFSIVAVNAPFLKECGMREEEVIGRTCYAVTHNRNALCEAPDDICPLLETMASGRHEVAEHVHYGAGGEKLFVEVSTSPIRDKDGRIIQVAHVSRDITERKRGEEKLKRYAAELQESNDELRNFNYIFFHDLREPMVNLKGFAGELQANLTEATELVGESVDRLAESVRGRLTTILHQESPEALKFINASVQQMDHLFNAILALSLLTRRKLKPEALDMAELVQSAATAHVHQAAKLTIGPLPALVADRTYMKMIIGHLLDNAVKYLEPGRPGEIEVSGESGNGATTIHISDNGRGIAHEDLPKIFDIFRRAGKQDVPGEGMGLPYAKTMVRRHGGRIWCVSELGVGSIFSFSILHKPDIAE